MLFHKSAVYISFLKKYRTVKDTQLLLPPHQGGKGGSQKVVKPFLSMLNELEATILNQAPNSR